MNIANPEMPLLNTVLFIVIIVTGLGILGCGIGNSTQTIFAPEPVVLISKNNSGISGSADSRDPAISQNGQFITFESIASNLVSNDNNSASDAFLRDMDTRIITRVSVAAAGTEANNSNYNPDITADGRYIVFESDASNLVPGDNNSTRDVFVHDSVAGSISRVSVPTGTGEGNNYSQYPAISASGRYIAFESLASNLASGDTNNVVDIFVHDIVASSTSRVSVASTTGAEANGPSRNPDITPDGRFVAFFSEATNLVTGDTNGVDDVFVHDRSTGKTSRVSVSTMGAQANKGSWDLRLSADGRYVVFESDATNLDGTDTNSKTDVFIRDRDSGETKRISWSWQGLETDGFSGAPEISPDGRYVVFRSIATNLVSGDTNGVEDVFVYDTTTGSISLVSVSAAGTQGDNISSWPEISNDNRYITFESKAANLIAGTIDYPVRHIYRAPRP